MQLQKQEHYINLQMDPLCDPLTTCPIQMGWEIWIESYPNRRFGCVENPDRQFGNGSVLTRTRTRHDSLEPLLILVTIVWPIQPTFTMMITHVSSTPILFNALSSSCNSLRSGIICRMLQQRNSMMLRNVYTQRWNQVTGGRMYRYVSWITS